MDFVKAIQWQDDCVILLDQTLLPEVTTYLKIDNYRTMGAAIQKLQVRGAPAIGIAAAYGLVLGLRDVADTESHKTFFERLTAVSRELNATRPTAVNLSWALKRMAAIAEHYFSEPIPVIKNQLLTEAQKIHVEDKQMCAAIGKNGAGLIQPGMCVLTHCNAGALATGGMGTALAPLYTAAATVDFQVFADETRPLLQGSRLTAWELQQAGIPVTVICDNMAAFLMQQHKIDLIIVGADRIAGNGDTANKIGTYNLACLAEKHQLPFYVAAPSSTFDFSLADGQQIPVEERAADEIRHGFGKKTAPDGVSIYNPAFDITPAELIHGYITEKGVLVPPFPDFLKNNS